MFTIFSATCHICATVPYEWGLGGEGVRVLPLDHHLVDSAPAQVGAYRPLEVVDEGVLAGG